MAQTDKTQNERSHDIRQQRQRERQSKSPCNELRQMWCVRNHRHKHPESDFIRSLCPSHQLNIL